MTVDKKRRLALMAVAVILVLMSVGVSYQIWEAFHGSDRTPTDTGQNPELTKCQDNYQACRARLVNCDRQLTLIKKNLSPVVGGKAPKIKTVTVIDNQTIQTNKIVDSLDRQFSVSYKGWDGERKKAVLVITPYADQKAFQKPLSRTESYAFTVNKHRYKLLVVNSGPDAVTIRVTRYQ
ncbi:MAG: hypothetical protein KKC37_01620 [Proteobacteria bacterium]|nr:hypothetical protein [Pseudomonadota bacterium]